jgi:DNA-binding transcriptional ArsR family regulator
MGEPDKAVTLAGLVSQEAELLYRRLRAAGSVPAAGFRDSGAAAAELLDTGIAFPTGRDDTMIRPVDPATALRLLIGRRQRELVARQDQIIEGWRRLTALLPPTCGAVDQSADQWSRTSPGELQLRVLRMMPTDDDAAIARRLRLSVSTVRRHIKSLYEMLGVDNRFAAGMVAAKRGWV